MTKKKVAKKPIKKKVIKKKPLPNFGLFWHIHHEGLYEWTNDIRERIAFIKRNKNDIEIPIRLRWMNPVKGPVGDQSILKKIPGLMRKYRSATRAYQKSTGAAAARKAQAIYDKSEDALMTARNQFMGSVTIPDMEALHKREHKNCPWNGKTIFPKVKGA